MAYSKLSPEETEVIEKKATEPPFSGQYDNFYKDGVYICRKCNNPLFSSKAKFDAQCGWPAFDEHFEKSILWLPDPDGHRTEIQCANCSGHLGHVFEGEGFTTKNTRHCVNSLSIKFIPEGEQVPKTLNGRGFKSQTK